MARCLRPACAWLGLLATLLVATSAGVLLAPRSATAQSDPSSSEAGEPAADEAPTRSKRRDPSDWSDWRNYQPSISGGFGVTFDHVDSSLYGINRWRPGGQVPQCTFYPTANYTCVEVEDSYGGFVSGGAFNLGGRLTLPEFDAPAKPQLFANASWVSQRQGRKPLAYWGLPQKFWANSVDFLGGGGGEDPFLRAEQTIEPESLLFVGFGTSFLLPIDAYPVRLNGTVNYFRAKARVGARYDYTSSAQPNANNPRGDTDQFVSEELVTHGIAPGVGLDAVIGETSLFTFGFYTDFFVGFPLSGTSYEETLTNGYINPTSGPEEKIDFHFDRDVNYSVFVGLRLSLTRD